MGARKEMPTGRDVAREWWGSAPMEEPSPDFGGGLVVNRHLIFAAFKAGWSAGISAERWGGHDTAEAAFDDWLKRRDWKEPCLCNFNQKMVGDGCWLCNKESA